MWRSSATSVRASALHLLLAVAVLGSGAGTASAQPADGGMTPSDSIIRRVAGFSRIETAVEVSRTAFPTADTVVVARADAYADALAAAPLAGQSGGPVLLTGRDGLHPVVDGEIRRLGATRAYVIGSETALSPAVIDGLRQAGVDTVQRLGGATRFETAALIGGQLEDRSRGFIVQGVNADPARGWPDAVAVSAYAAYVRAPVFLVEQDSAPEPTLRAIDELGIGGLEVIGGADAVSDAVIDQIEQTTGVDAGRFLPTEDRFETSVAIAGAGVDIGMSGSTPWLATASDWPDALVAGPAAAAQDSILLLIDGTDLESGLSTYRWLENSAATLDQVTIVGDETVVSARVADQVDQLHREASNG